MVSYLLLLFFIFVVTLILFYLFFYFNFIYSFIFIIIRWESTILLLWYIAYVTFMKFNENIEHSVKKTLARGKVGQSANDVNESNGGPHSESSDANVLARRSSIPILHGGGSKFRQGVLQLMISSVDPLNDGTMDPEKFRAAMMKNMNGDANRNNSNGGVPGSNGTVPSIQVTQV